MEEHNVEIVNRMKNIIWTVCGDYSMETKPDVEVFLRDKYLALYDGIKQGAFAKYFNKEEVSLYLVKKVFLQAMEAPLLEIAQLCMEIAVGKRIAIERKGVENIRKKAYEFILEEDFEWLVKSELGILKIELMRNELDGRMETKEDRLRERIESLRELENATETIEVIRKIDECYNAWVDKDFVKREGTLENVLSISMEELMEFDWRKYLSEEMYEENFAAYMEKMMQEVTQTSQRKKDADFRNSEKNIRRISEEEFQKIHSYVELNFGRSYQTPLDKERTQNVVCRGTHANCSLHFTDGILANPVQRNYSFEYAKKQQSKNKYAYHFYHAIVKRNIELLTGTLRKSIQLRQEEIEMIADRGRLYPERLWKVGRTSDAKIFSQKQKMDGRELVVDLLIDASGSQRVRQDKVVLQAYIIMQALSNAKIPHRVMSYCTFWNHTILQRFREYDDSIVENEQIFSFVTSSNNRDGLAIKAIAQGLLEREEEQKILIILSDGRPYDAVVNRPNLKIPASYQGDLAVRDTGFEVRRLRNMGVAVLGVFVGEEQDLEAEKKIFGKDFAYIRDMNNFSLVVGQYLVKQLLNEE